MEKIKGALFWTLERDHPMTVRQVYYQLVSQGVIAKTEGEYKSTVVRLLAEMRRAGDIPFGWIADSTRWMRKPRTYNSVEDALERTAQHYRRSLWADADAYVEIWLEKDALAGVLSSVTEEFDVPLMVTRGYPSISYLHSAGELIDALDVPVYLYYFGDYDPSGLDITRAVQAGIREFAPDADLTFERVAVTRDQIIDLNLPTRPTKTSDSRSKNFAGQSVEVDAIPPAQLRDLTRACIEQHINWQDLNAILVAEESERQALFAFARGAAEGGEA
jgi:hypothetical protein